MAFHASSPAEEPQDGSIDIVPGADDTVRWDGNLLEYQVRPGVVVVTDPRNTLSAGVGNGLWAAGRVLSGYLALRPSLCRAKRVVELGAGVGVVGLTAAACGAEDVVLTDVDQQLPLLARNRDRSDYKQVLSVHRLDWRLPEDRKAVAALAKPAYDLVVASDVGYDEDLLDPLVETIAALSTQETTILIAIADRTLQEEAEPGVADFLHAASPYFSCKEVAAHRLEPHQSISKVLMLTKR